MRRPVPHLVLAFALAALAATAACTDRNPAALPDLPEPTLPPAAMAMLTCTASVADGTLACRAPDAVGPSGVSAAILGGQGEYVRLASTGASYDSAASTFRMDVTLQNLTAQALGTADGVTPSADGVRVFFSTPPVATQGTGAVEVANADGEGFFTAAAQKYFRYDGILPPEEESAAKEWRFTVPNTVATFSFGVYVAAPVRAESGWISLSPLAPSLPVGGETQMTAVLRNVAGEELAPQPVSWSTTNPAVAKVDAQGLVYAVSPGSAVITAFRGARSSSVRVAVYASGGAPVPGVVNFGMIKSSVEADGQDALPFRADVAAPPGVSTRLLVYLRHPNGGERTCTPSFSEPTCRFSPPPGSLGGAWRIERVTVGTRVVTRAELLAAGAPAHVYVHSAFEERVPPTIDSLTLAPAAVSPLDTVHLTVSATDDGVGVDMAEAWVSSPGNPQMHWFPRIIIGTLTGATHLRFKELVPGYFQGGTFTLDSVRVEDHNLNRRTLNTAELAARGLPTQFTVTGTDPDTVPPTITGFSFTPDTIAGNGADPVTVTFSATEPAGRAGVWFMDMEFVKVNDPTQLRRCLVNGTNRVFERTMTCSQTFGAADVGAWEVRYIRAIDFQDNASELDTQQLRAAGYPTLLTVTGTPVDATAPTITAFSLSPATVAGNGADSVTITLAASEPAAETGLWFMDVVLERVSDTSQRHRCLLSDPGAQHVLTLTCRLAFAAGDAGAWRIRYVRAIDVMYNSRVLRNADLQAAGYPVDVMVTTP